MAVLPSATGLVDIRVAIAGYQSGTLQSLGHSDDMTDVSERAYWHNVPGDRNGGPQGPPIEVQYLGAIAIVTFTLSEWEADVVNELRKRAVNTALGVIPQVDVGAFMLRTRGIRLLLNSPSNPVNFPVSIVREPIGYGMGTKYQAMTFQFECHKAPPGHAKEYVLYDSDIADP